MMRFIIVIPSYVRRYHWIRYLVIVDIQPSDVNYYVYAAVALVQT